MCTSSMFSDFARLLRTPSPVVEIFFAFWPAWRGANSAGSAGVRPATAHGSAMLAASSPGPSCRSGRKTQSTAPRRPSLGRGRRGADVPGCVG
jgi:hypothetical protein